MLNVSNDFLTAIKADENRTDALAIVDFGPELDYPFATVVASSTAVGFYADQICDGIMTYLDKAYTGNYIPSVFNDPIVGWKGTQVSDASGSLASSEIITITYDELTHGNFFVVGTEDNYPVDFTIEVFDTGWTTIATVTGNTDYLYALKTSNYTFTKVRITITKISLGAGNYAQLMEAGAVLNICFTSDEMNYVNVLEEAFSDNSPIGSPSANTVALSLYNDGTYVLSNTSSYLYGLMRPGRRIRPYVGVEVSDDTFECVPLGVFWSEDWIVEKKATEFVLNGFDRMRKTMGIEYPQLPPANGKEV